MFEAETQDGFLISIPPSFHGYKIIQLLGCGSTCVVYLVEDENTHSLFSAKIISKEDVGTRNLIPSIEKEIRVMKSLDHPNIIKLHDSFEMRNEYDEEFIIIIIEYCSNGDLLSYATQHGFDTEEQRTTILKGFLEAVRYLHNRSISHGDIKAENILLDSQLNAKLCDFGYCRTTFTAGDEAKNGTLYYAAPELFRKGQFDTLKSDIWAIGITIYSLYELQFPFQDGNQQYIVEQIVKGRLNIRNGIDKRLNSFVRNCTRVDPNNRPNIEDVINDQLFYDQPVQKSHGSSSKVNYTNEPKFNW